VHSHPHVHDEELAEAEHSEDVPEHEHGH
jgi:hypothetical protein